MGGANPQGGEGQQEGGGGGAQPTGGGGEGPFIDSTDIWDSWGKKMKRFSRQVSLPSDGLLMPI